MNTKIPSNCDKWRYIKRQEISLLMEFKLDTYKYNPI